MTPVRGAATRPLGARTRLLVVAVGVSACASCSVQDSHLLTRQVGAAGNGQGGGAGATSGNDLLAISGSGPVTQAVAAAINERPIGGASLKGGTSGGGTYEVALRLGQLHYVTDVEGIRVLIGQKDAAIILVAPGTYDFATSPTSVSVCPQACDTATPILEQMTAGATCTDGTTLDDVHDVLRFASNKTLIGLGTGATFRNAQLELSAGASNIILRNLVIEDVAQDINGVGYGISVWPGHHVWIDHCTFRNIGRGYVNIVSTTDSTDATIEQESGYVTLTHNHFDGKVDGVCEQRSQMVVRTSRNPALTFAYNFFDRSQNRNPFIFGPETWAHVFNNYWSDIPYAGLAAACDASALLQGNAFESTNSAISINDNGVDSASYCATKPWGKVYAPMDTGTDEDNLFDSTSTLTLHDQPTDGTGIVKPSRVSGHQFRITVPTDSGTSTESYEVTLYADPSTTAAAVQADAGAGKLF